MWLADTEGELCQYCVQDYLKPWNRCICCDNRVTQLHQGLCAKCASKKSAIKVVCACHYHHLLASHIGALKLGKQHALKPLINILLKRIEHAYQSRPLPKLLLPIPMHITKERQRGFNLAYTIAYELALQLNIELADKLLVKAKITAPQAGKDRAERIANLHGCFTRLATPSSPEVAIIDDVFTTGTTAKEAARSLGIRLDTVWVLARARAPTLAKGG